jgi:hypothetical protein
MRLVSLLAAVGLTFTALTAFAGDNAPRPAGPSADAHQSVRERGEPVIRPPRSIPSSRGYPHAVAPSSTDRHVAEFLRWKEQHANPPR